MPRKRREARQNRHSEGAIQVPRLDEDELMEKLQNATEPPLLLILDGVQDPHNLGACLRSADAAGVMAVVAPKDRSCSITETVMRVSCGGAGSVPLVRVTNLARAMRRFQEAGVWISGTSDQGEKDLFEADLTGPLAIVLGAEGEGMRRLTTEGCDFLLKIPMAGRVDCLNVSVASGVCLFEAVRQRKVAKPA